MCDKTDCKYHDIYRISGCSYEPDDIDDMEDRCKEYNKFTPKPPKNDWSLTCFTCKNYIQVRNGVLFNIGCKVGEKVGSHRKPRNSKGWKECSKYSMK